MAMTWADYNKQVTGVAPAPQPKNVAPVKNPAKSWDALNASVAGTSAPQFQAQKVNTLQSEADVAKQQADKAARSANFFGKIVNAPARAILGPDKPVTVKGVPVPTSVAEVFNLPFQGINAAEKVLGAGVQYGVQKIKTAITNSDKGNKSFGQLYKEAPTAGRMVADTLTDITAKNRADRNIPMTTADYFFPELFGQISDAGVTAAILAPLGSRIATKYKTETISPEQMADVMTGRQPKGAPLKPETVDIIKKEVLAPGTTKEIIKTAVKNGVDIKTAGPAGPIRQIVGGFIGGGPEGTKNEITIKGQKITTPEQITKPAEITAPKSWDEFNNSATKASETAPAQTPEGTLTKAAQEDWDNNYADEYGQLDTQYNQLRQIKKPSDTQIEQMAETADKMLTMEANFVNKYKGVSQETQPKASDLFLTPEEVKAKGLPAQTPGGIPIDYRRNQNGVGNEQAGNSNIPQTSNLLEEAKKYKSADEFANSILSNLEKNSFRGKQENLRTKDYSLEIQPIESFYPWEAKTPGDQPRIDRIKTAIQNGEFLPPVLGYQGAEKIMVPDGHNRIEAYRELGYTEVPVLMEKQGKGSGKIININDFYSQPEKPKSVFQKIGTSLKEKQVVPREEYLKKQIEKQIDIYRRGAQIMPTNEGAGVRRYTSDRGTGKSYSSFKLSRAKGDMARRSSQSKAYAMQELMANDPNFAQMVAEYENILGEKQAEAKANTDEMQPAFKRAPAKPRGFLASIGAKKSIENMAPKSTAPTKEGGFILSDKAKQILNEMGIPISEKTLSNRMLGVFKHLSENVRVQSIHDITTVVHEATHAIDKQVGLTKKLMEVTGMSKNGNPIYSKETAKIRQTLTDIYEEMYSGTPLASRRSHSLATRMKEGLATFIENYFYNPAGMVEKYPELVNNFIKPEGKFNTPEINTLLAKMNELVDEYAKLSPDERIGARIRRGDEVVKRDSGFTYAQRAEFEILNRFEPLKRYARKMEINGTWDDPTVQGFNLLNKNAFVANFYTGDKIPIFMPDGNFEFKTGNVEDYLKLIKGKDKEFDTYLTARRVIANHDKYELAKDEYYSIKEDLENMIKVKNDGYMIDNKALKELLDIKKEYERWKSILEKDDFRLQDATATVEKYAEEFKKAEELYDNINKYLIDWSENTGMLDGEKADTYRNDKGYASWKRYIDDEISSKSVGSISGSKGKVSAFKERTGSDLDIISPVYNQLVSINEVIGKGLENALWERVYNLSKKSPEIARRFEEIEATPAVDKDGNISFPQERDPSLIRVFIKGKRRFFKPAPEFVALAKNLKPEEFTPLDAFLRIPASLFTRLTTSANPIWSLGNLAVDQFSALTQTKTRFKPVIDPARSLKDYIMGNELVKDYIALGGKKQTMASFYRVSPEEIPNKIFKQIGSMKKGAKAAHVVGRIIDAPLNLLETPANVSEILTRFSEYRRAIDQGDNMSVAMYKASEVTIPFQLQGNFWGASFRKYIKAIPYFNAAIQAIYKFGRSARSNPARVATVGAGLLASALTSAIALMVLASDKQKRLLSEQPARLLARYLYIPSPNGEDLIRLRIPEQFGAITGMAYLWAISHYGGNEASMKEYLDVMMSGLPDQLNISEPKKMVLAWLPQTVKPTVEVITNTKTYPEVRPIVPDYMKYKKPSERYTTYTSNVGKFLGQLTNTSPAMIDFWIKEQFGAAGNALVTTRLPNNPIYLQEKDYVLTGRSWNNFYDQKDMVDYQYNLLQDFTKGKTDKDPMFSEKEAEEIRSKHKLNTEVADVLSEMRKLAQDKNFELSDSIKESAYELLKNIDKNSTDKSFELMMNLKNKVYAAK